MNLDDSSDRNGQPIDPSFGLDDSGDVSCALLAGAVALLLLAAAWWAAWSW